jgi:hypothetical protein
VLQEGVIQSLTGDAFRFWSDPALRERMLRDILDARSRQERARALQAVDHAVVQGMAALGFPRAPVRSLMLVMPSRPHTAGQKFSTCDLQIGLPMMQRELGPGGAPDAIVETWIHESVHGRRFPWGPNAHAQIGFPGFEEGLAEGVARLISRRGSLRPGLHVYGRYVQAYEELAHVIGVNPETIYSRLYHRANGSVMDAFVSDIDTLQRADGAPPMTPDQRGRLDRTAKRLFDVAHEHESASARLRMTMRRAWRRACR